MSGEYHTFEPFFYLQMDAKLHTDNLTKILDIIKQGSNQVHAVLDGVLKKNNVV